MAAGAVKKKRELSPMVHASVTMGPDNGVATLEHHKSWLGNIYPICFRDSEWLLGGKEASLLPQNPLIRATKSLSTGYPMLNCCWHGALPHFSLQGISLEYLLLLPRSSPGAAPPCFAARILRYPRASLLLRNRWDGA